jgi:hypothetical protein
MKTKVIVKNNLLDILPDVIDILPNIIDPSWSLCLNHLSLESIWLEYSCSFQGKPSIIMLNEKYKASWRNKESVRQLYCRRKKVYNAVYQVAKAKQISELEAAKLLDLKRIEQKKTVAFFQDNVCKSPQSIIDLMDLI